VKVGCAAKIKRGDNQHENKTIRNMFSAILKKHSDLSLVENSWGALQVKRNGDVLFSARRGGDMIISRPMFTGTGKNRERLFKHPGNHYDYLSSVPLNKVTLAMLEDRVKDPKSTKDYYAEIYKGREAEAGWNMRKAAAAKRVGEVVKEAKGKVSKKTVEKIVAKRKATELKRTPVRKALAQVAAEASA